jgi:hypothetical protein
MDADLRAEMEQHPGGWYPEWCDICDSKTPCVVTRALAAMDEACGVPTLERLAAALHRVDHPAVPDCELPSGERYCHAKALALRAALLGESEEA